MRTLLFLCLPVLMAGSSHAADDTARIEALRLFKNGLAVVRLTDKIPDAGSVTIHHVPSPVHGTFWVQSDKPVTARAALQAIPVPLGSISQADLLRRLAGKAVTLHLESDSLQGTLLGSDATAEKPWDRDYASQERGRHGWNGGHGSERLAVTQSSLILLQLVPGKIVAIEPGQIRRVEFDRMPEITAERPVLRLEAQGAAQVAVDYLTKGISWAPNYRVDLSDPAKLLISQQAVIRNELVDLKEVEFQLISGFPSVRYAAVDSPLSPGSTWAGFFSQVNQSGRGDGPGDPFSNSGAIFNQTVQLGREPASAADLGAADPGEGVDLHYESIGRRSLGLGETLAVNVATASSPYERVVEWHVPDIRDARGRPVEEYQRRQQSQEGFDETPWDAIRFANPFKFPMTTAPATLVSGAQFQGQQICAWTNPGEQVSIRIAKALSISTRAAEHEIPESRQNLRIAGDDCYKARVEGKLTVKSYRARPAVLIIKRRFSGELLEAAGNPSKQLLEEGVYSVNKRNELSWRLELAAGAEQTLEYQYEVLVDQ